MTQVFTAILLTSCIGTVLAAILLALRLLTRRIFSAAWHYYMWLVVLFVMVCPIRLTLPEHPVKNEVVVVANEGALAQNEVPTIADEPIQDREAAPVAALQALPSQKRSTSKVTFFLQGLLVPAANIWFVGILLLFVIKVMGYVRFLVKVRRHTEVIHCPQLSAFTDLRIKTRVSDAICSPLITGLFKPTLILPKMELTETQLCNILAHEITHLSRGDLIYKWFVSLVKCVHWFNPVVYSIGRQVNIDCEIACDEAVTREMNDQEKKGYVETILSLLSNHNQRTVPLTTGMAGDKKTLKKRFSMIKNKLHISKKTAIISAVVAVIVLVGALVGSGLLNGSLLPGGEEELLQIFTDVREGDNFNVLLLGLDEQGRADAIMVLFCKESSITGISIPRDSVFTPIGTEIPQKISEILLMENGDQVVVDSVRNRLSVPIHYYAKMNLSVVRDVVDGLGGVEFDVAMDMVYDDPAQNLHINIPSGVRVLSGEEACGVLRFRGTNGGRVYALGDLTRVSVGQQFMKEFVRQKLNKDSVAILPGILKRVSGNLQTNYPLQTFLTDIKRLLEADLVLDFSTLPGTPQQESDEFVYKLTEPEEAVPMEDGIQIEYDSETGEVVALQSYPSFEGVWPQNDMAKIKSLARAGEAYPGFEHIVLHDKAGEQIETILEGQGLSANTGSMVNLKTNYAVMPYDTGTVQVQADENGNISLYMPGYEQNYKVQFYDGATKEDVGGYLVLGNDTNAYTFLGFLQGKTYDMTVESTTGTDWVQSGRYYIY